DLGPICHSRRRGRRLSDGPLMFGGSDLHSSQASPAPLSASHPRRSRSLRPHLAALPVLKNRKVSSAPVLARRPQHPGLTGVQALKAPAMPDLPILPHVGQPSSQLSGANLSPFKVVSVRREGFGILVSDLTAKHEENRSAKTPRCQA